MITVIATRTHRRANRNFERGVSVEINPEDLTEEESQALLADPELSIRELAASEKKHAAAEKTEKPELSAEERAEKLSAALLQPIEAGDLNKDGTPKVKVMTERVGFEVTKAEIAEAQTALAPANEGGDAENGQPAN